MITNRNFSWKTTPIAVGTAKNLTRSAWWQMSDLKRISSEVRFKLDDAGKLAEKGTLKRQADAVRVGVMSAFFVSDRLMSNHAWWRCMQNLYCILLAFAVSLMSLLNDVID